MLMSAIPERPKTKCAVLPVTETPILPITESESEQPRSNDEQRTPNSEATAAIVKQQSTKSEVNASIVKEQSAKSTDSAVEPGQFAWQWLHRTGFRNYDEKDSARIERAYQDGLPFLRLKSGKGKSVPMEVFFADMVQHDPISGNQRKIQRVGANSKVQMIFRQGAKFVHNIRARRLRQITLEEYCQHRQKLAFHNDAMVMKMDSSKSLSLTPPSKQTRLIRMSKFEESWTLAWCRKVSKHPIFTSVTYFVVIINIIYVGVDADVNQDQALTSKDVGFQVIEHLFCFYFAFELLVRFGAFKRKKDCKNDHWFIFDSLLLLLMVAEVWVLSIVLAIMDQPDDDGAPVGGLGLLRIARLLRLARLGRIAQILKIFPEVMTMLKGILEATRSVFFTVLLLLVLLFIFGIVFKVQASDKPDIQEIFPSVSRSMWVLLLRGTFLDSPSLFFDSLDDSPELVVLFVLFIFLSSFTVLNMLIGILCDVIRHVSDLEKDKAAVADLKQSLLGLLECFDKDDDNAIGKDEFDLVMQNPEINQILRRYKVDPVDMLSLKDTLYEERETAFNGDADGPPEKKLAFFEFLEVVLRLRGGNSASVMDIIDLRTYIVKRQMTFEEQMKAWQKSQGEAQQKLGEDVKLIGLQLEKLQKTLSASSR